MSEETAVRVPSDGDRGPVSSAIVQGLQNAHTQAGTAVFLIVCVVFCGILYTLFSAVLSMPFLPAFVTELVALVAAVGYVVWAGGNAHVEATEYEHSELISRRPTIGSVQQALELLQSANPKVRANASTCLAELVSLGPKKLVNESDKDEEAFVSVLISFLRDDEYEVRKNIARTLPHFARDTPGAVSPHSEFLLQYLNPDRIDTEVLANVALSIGYLALTSEIDPDKFDTTAMDLSEHSDPDVRIGACYMLTAIGSSAARERINEIATSDPNERVKQHAEVL